MTKTSTQRVRLAFDPGHAGEDATRSDLSSVVIFGPDLWTANDELARVERLTRTEDGGFARHRPFAVADYIDLPDDDDDEMDIEGLAVDGGYLWITGSHSKTRKKPEPGEHDPDKVLDRLTTLKNSPNRYFLGRIPLLADREQRGSFRPAKAVTLEDGLPERTAAALPFRAKKGNALRARLLDDEHLGPFMHVPCKENGFDVEGLAVRGERVFLGLRGPVLRGWAVVLELRVKTGKDGALKLARTGGGDKVRKHFLDLGGLGIRELRAHGDDVLILAGPTMDLSEPVFLYRWRGALGENAPAAVVFGGDLERVMELPVGDGEDHPEGLAILAEDDGGTDLLVVHDSPSRDRLHAKDHALDADVLRLKAARAKTTKKGKRG